MADQFIKKTVPERTLELVFDDLKEVFNRGIHDEQKILEVKVAFMRSMGYNAESCRNSLTQGFPRFEMILREQDMVADAEDQAIYPNNG